MAYTVLLDACVLYSAPLRDILLRLALSDLYRVKWSADIHDEWMRNLATNRPDLSKASIERLREKMDSHVRDAVVEDYSSLIPGLTLPDPGDRHVLAAAILGRADLIVTFNLNDFPPAALKPYGIEAQHPDEFLRHQFDLAPDHVLAGICERGMSDGPTVRQGDTDDEVVGRSGRAKADELNRGQSAAALC